jgi:hypothetical protein
MAGDSGDDDFIASIDEIPALHLQIKRLKDSPYGRRWQTGGEFEIAGEVAEVSDALLTFGREMAAVGSGAVKKEMSIQVERAKAALRLAADTIVEKIECEASKLLKQERLEGPQGVFRAEFKVVQPALSRVHFEADIKEWERTHSWQETDRYAEKRRRWYYLWLKKGDVTLTRTVQRSKTTSGIHVDALDGLIYGFERSASTDQLDREIASWMRDVIATFESDLAERLKGGIQVYRNALEARLAEIEQGAQMRIERINERLDDIGLAKEKVEKSNEWRSLAYSDIRK